MLCAMLRTKEDLTATKAQTCACDVITQPEQAMHPQECDSTAGWNCRRGRKCARNLDAYADEEIEDFCVPLFVDVLDDIDNDVASRVVDVEVEVEDPDRPELLVVEVNVNTVLEITEMLGDVLDD
eukprot:6478993-Amphidinium_carterae.1